MLTANCDGCDNLEDCLVAEQESRTAQQQCEAFSILKRTSCHRSALEAQKIICAQAQVTAEQSLRTITEQIAAFPTLSVTAEALRSVHNACSSVPQQSTIFSSVTAEALSHQTHYPRDLQEQPIYTFAPIMAPTPVRYHSPHPPLVVRHPRPKQQQQRSRNSKIPTERLKLRPCLPDRPRRQRPRKQPPEESALEKLEEGEAPPKKLTRRKFATAAMESVSPREQKNINLLDELGADDVENAMPLITIPPFHKNGSTKPVLVPTTASPELLPPPPLIMPMPPPLFHRVTTVVSPHFTEDWSGAAAAAAAAANGDILDATANAAVVLAAAHPTVKNASSRAVTAALLESRPSGHNSGDQGITAADDGADKRHHPAADNRRRSAASTATPNGDGWGWVTTAPVDHERDYYNDATRPFNDDDDDDDDEMSLNDLMREDEVLSLSDSNSSFDTATSCTCVNFSAV